MHRKRRITTAVALCVLAFQITACSSVFMGPGKKSTNTRNNLPDEEVMEKVAETQTYAGSSGDASANAAAMFGSAAGDSSGVSSAKTFATLKEAAEYAGIDILGVKEIAGITFKRGVAVKNQSVSAVYQNKSNTAKFTKSTKAATDEFTDKDTTETVAGTNVLFSSNGAVWNSGNYHYVLTVKNAVSNKELHTVVKNLVAIN